MPNDDLKDTVETEYNREAEIEKLLQERHENEIKTTKAKTKKRALIIVAAAVLIVGIIATVVYTTVIIPKGHYERGEKYLAEKNWDEAIAEFNLAGASEKAQETKYDQANTLLSEENFDRAISLFLELKGYKDADNLYKEGIYRRAKKAMSEGHYAKAYFDFNQIAGYKDADDVLKTDSHVLAVKDKISAFTATNRTVFFGRYEQDGNGSNGAESIEWIVMDVQDNKSLLVSKYALDEQDYHEEVEDVTWETCTLRTWLNDTFMNKAFEAKEQEAIILTTVDNSNSQGNPKYETVGGNDTQDKLFLLSYKESLKYFKSKSGRACKPSKVVEKSYTMAGICQWWLRSPGRNQRDASAVFRDGEDWESKVWTGHHAIRPALWIDLSSDYFD